MQDDRVPSWIQPFLKGSYFAPCPSHAGAHKSERNFFCVQCDGQSLCQLCVHKNHSGPGHDVVQIRRSSYHDAVRVNEISRLLDLSNIQVYVINGAKIVFLNGRPQARLVKGAAHYCETCNRTLTDASRFCSIGCKLAALRHDPTITLSPRLKPISPLLLARAEEDRAQLAERPELSAGSSHSSGYVLGSATVGVKRMRVEPQASLLSDVSEDSGDGGSVLSQEVKGRKAYSLPPLENVANSSPQFAVKPQFSDGGVNVPGFFRSRKRKGVPHRSPLF